MEIQADGLPPGIHDTTLDELREHYGFTPSRAKMLAALELLLAQLLCYGVAAEILIGGSFLLGRNRTPSDIDCVVAICPQSIDAMPAPEREKVKAILTKNTCRTAPLDLYCFNQRDAHQYAYWLGWLTYSRSGEVRGLARILLNAGRIRGTTKEDDRRV